MFSHHFQKEENQASNGDTGEKEYKPHNIPSRMGMKVPCEKGSRRTTGRMNGGNPGGDEKSSPAKGAPVKQETESDKSSSFSKELARLQFFGAGPKLAGVPTEKNTRDKTRGVKLNFEYDPVSDEIKTYKTII